MRTPVRPSSPLVNRCTGFERARCRFDLRPHQFWGRGVWTHVQASSTGNRGCGRFGARADTSSVPPHQGAMREPRHRTNRRAPPLVRGDARTVEGVPPHRRSRVRDRLVLTFAPLVKYIVYKKVREMPARCEVEDFISCGLEALIHSIERYDPDKGATLEQYAWTRIHGAVLDELRRQDWAPALASAAGSATSSAPRAVHRPARPPADAAPSWPRRWAPPSTSCASAATRSSRPTSPR